jgi:hypothetical protein
MLWHPVGLHGGYSKYSCFIRLWDSGASNRHCIKESGQPEKNLLHIQCHSWSLCSSTHTVATICDFKLYIKNSVFCQYSALMCSISLLQWTAIPSLHNIEQLVLLVAVFSLLSWNDQVFIYNVDSVQSSKCLGKIVGGISAYASTVKLSSTEVPILEKLLEKKLWIFDWL